jgi:GT2 family glycosyltransferase
MRVLVILPTYNRYLITKKCIQALLNQTLKPYKIVVCDSDSSDSTCSLYRISKIIKILKLTSNHWWSHAINAGFIFSLKYSYDYLLIINDDIKFNKFFIEELVSDGISNPNKIISANQIDQKGKFGGFLYKTFLKIPLRVNVPSSHIDISNGCSLLIPRSCLNVRELVDSNLLPHMSGDFYLFCQMRNRGFKARIASKATIKQIHHTPYQDILTFTNFLFSNKSPYHFRSYVNFGAFLFRGKIKFLFFGVFHHLQYLFRILSFCFLKAKKND